MAMSAIKIFAMQIIRLIKNAKMNVKDIFEYDESIGPSCLKWKAKIAKQVMIGSMAGSIDDKGYWKVGFLKQSKFAHHVIWFLHNGYWPKKNIDHIDGNPANNAIKNLREASHLQNNQNRRLDKRSTSNAKNVCWCERDKKWRVIISFNCKRLSFGSYKDLELAKLVSIEAREKYHGKFARHA